MIKRFVNKIISEISKSVLLIGFIFLVSNSWGQVLVEWNTFGNAGTETTEPSVSNSVTVSSSTLTFGAGVSAAGNTNRFGGSGWSTGTVANAVTGNNYIQFVLAPTTAGCSVTPTSFVFSWDKSGTGPGSVALRSSADSYAANIGAVASVAAMGTFNTITITGLTFTASTTFRLYGYGASAGSGTGGFDIASNIVNVQLLGSTSCAASCTAPTATLGTTSQTLCTGSATSFSVGTDAGGAATYTWQASTSGSAGTWTNVVNGTPTGASYSGVNAATLSYTTGTAGLNYYYQCVVTNTTAACTASSNTNSVTVRQAPSITSSSSSQTLCTGSMGSFTVAASGTSPTYQWQQNTGSGYVNISAAGSNPTFAGYTTSSLSITSPTSASSYSYQCVVSVNSCSSVSITPVVLTVVLTPTAALSITTQTLCSSSANSFSVSSNASTPSYTWQSSSNGTSGWVDVTNGLPTGAVYSGSNTATLSYTTGTGSGTRYYKCIVANSSGCIVTSNTNSVTVRQAPTITSSSASKAICTGSTTSFIVAATGTSPTYQWQQNTGSGYVNISNGGSNPTFAGATSSSLSISSPTAASNFSYQCVVSVSSCSSVTTTPVVLSVSASPANDLCSGASTIAIDAPAVTGNLNCASPTAGLTDYPTENDVWYAFTPTCTATHTVTMTFTQTGGIDYDLDVFTTITCPTTGTAAYSSYGTTNVETIVRTFTSGVTYYVRVIDFETTGGTFSVGVVSNCAAIRTVTFNANGGSGSMSNQTASSATNINSNTFTNGVCTFLGWNTAANGSGTSYANNASYSFTVDATLYAQWTCNTISTPTISASSFSLTDCSATAVGTLTFTSVGTFSTGNIYTAQLSNSSGSFASPVSLGTLSSTLNTGTISVTIPALTTSGSGYLVRVISSNPGVISTSSSTLVITSNCTLTICPYLKAALINGCSGSCSGEGNNEFVVLNSGSYSIAATPANIKIVYSGGSPVLQNFTGSFAAQPSIITNLNSLAGCGNLFVDVSAGGVIPPGSTFFVMNQGSCFDSGSFADYCGLGTIYVVFSTDADWNATGYFGNNTTPRYFETDFIGVSGSCGVTTYSYNTSSSFDFGSPSGAAADGASVSFNGTTPNYISGGGNCVPSFEILPIELVDFYATNLGNSNNLIWKVASEIDVKNYVIEKSNDGIDFFELGKVPVNNSKNNSEFKSYLIIDHSPFDDITYYRLGVNNAKDYVQYYKIIFTDAEVSDWKTLLYQEDNYLTIEFKKTVPKNSTIQLFDLSGKLLVEELVIESQTKINATAFAEGIYFVKVTTPYKSENFKIIIQK